MSRGKRKPRVPVTRGPVVIDQLDQEARGVARLDGKVVFVAMALPGEEVTYLQHRNKPTYEEGEADEVLRASPERVSPRCAHFGVCGGCRLQHLDAAAQIRHKQQLLLEQLERIGKTQPDTVLEPLVAQPWGYRNKARLGAKFVDKKGRLLVGFRERAGKYLADVRNCPVLIPEVGDRLESLAGCVGGLQAKRQIPQVEVAASDGGVALVIRNLVELQDDDREALLRFGQEQGFRMFLQPGSAATVHPIDGGDELLSYQLPAFDLKLRFGPTDFTQVNAEINRQMVDRALDMLALTPGETVLDLFCGVGNFTLAMARSGADVCGVEGDPVLVERARENAQLNGLENVTFDCADLTKMELNPAWSGRRYDKLLLDPPRSGAQEMLGFIAKCGAQRVVYVSCNPSTLARDAGELTREHGFRLAAAGVMDMFPHTAHVESIALFERV